MMSAYLLPDLRGREFSFTADPALTWRTETDRENWRQQSAELELTRADGTQDRISIAGDTSVGVEWPWQSLGCYDTVEVRVRVMGTDGSQSEWSRPVVYQTGPLTDVDWHAQFIYAAADTGLDDDFGVSRFRRDVVVDDQLERAVLSYTAHGAVVFEVDGNRVDDEELAPGWTQYDKRLPFCTVDVTKQLTAGAHVLGATVGAGWYAEHFGFNGQLVRTWHGGRALSAQLRLEYSDGSVIMVLTDGEWSATTDGPIRESGIYMGEHVDARLADTGFLPHGELRGAAPAEVRETANRHLVPVDRPPVRVIETRTPVAVFQREGGAILDFGQNLSGRLRVKVTGAAGTEIVLRHAEVLENGELCLRLLRKAASTDRYVLAGDPGGEEWAPQFTYHGFRYAQISGIPAEQLSVTAEILHSDVARIGWLETGDASINGLFEAIVWTLRGNFFSVPTDCTARDERLGWTGNFGFVTASAAQIFDIFGFTDSWMHDVISVQGDNDGAAPPFVPKIRSVFPDGLAQAGWSDVSTVVPDVLYRHYGSKPLLAAHYPGMKVWVERLRRESNDAFWDAGRQLGDWLDPMSSPDHPEQSTTPTDFTANAYYIWSLDLTAAAARALGHEEDAEVYQTVADGVRAQFQERYLLPDGSLSVATQTAYAVAIAFRLLPESDARAGEELAQLVRDGGHRIGTGLIGTTFIADALTESGYRNDAQQLLLNREQPGWLAQLDGGATTIWERWDSIRPDGSINPGEMNSFNQYSLGCIADWMFRDIGGITPVEPGYRRFLVRPRAGATTSARSVLRTPYGTVQVDWKATQHEKGSQSQLEVEVIVPPNTTAIIDIPGIEPHEVGSGTHTIT